MAGSQKQEQPAPNAVKFAPQTKNQWQSIYQIVKMFFSLWKKPLIFNKLDTLLFLYDCCER